MSGTQADRLTKLTSQLVGDIGQLQGVTLDQATEQRLVQLLTDAFEEVGVIALNRAEQQSGDYQPCRCGEYETCATCLEAHRQFQQAKPLSPTLLEPLYAKHGKACGCGAEQSCHICLPLPGGITF